MVALIYRDGALEKDVRQAELITSVRADVAAIASKIKSYFARVNHDLLLSYASNPNLPEILVWFSAMKGYWEDATQRHNFDQLARFFTADLPRPKPMSSIVPMQQTAQEFIAFYTPVMARLTHAR